jgi:hypothetical protein
MSSAQYFDLIHFIRIFVHLLEKPGLNCSPLIRGLQAGATWQRRFRGPASIESKCPAPFPLQGTQNTKSLKNSEPFYCKGSRAFILLQVSNAGLILIRICPLKKGPGHRLENGGELFWQVGLIPT